MADITDIHPLLQAEEDARLLAEQPPVPEPEAQQPDVVSSIPEIPVPPVVSPPALPDDEQHYIKFDRRQSLTQQLRRLLEEDPEFSQAATTVAGRRAKREADARIAQLQAEIEEYKQQELARQIDDMPITERQQRLETDPAFRKTYDAYQARLAAGPQDVNLKAEQAYYTAQFEEMMERAEMHMPPDRVKLYQDAWTKCIFCEVNKRPGFDKHGSYDHDENGVFYAQKYRNNASLVNRARFDRMSALLNGEVEQRRLAAVNERAARNVAPVASAPPPPPLQVAPAPAPAPAPVVGSPNPRLQGQPDQSMVASRPGSNRPRITMEEYHQMPLDERFKRWPNPGDFERAAQAGELIGAPGYET